MGRDVRVSATLAGQHSLEPDGVREACEGMERALSGGPAPYVIRCLDSEFSKGEKKAPCLVSVDVNKTYYDVFWGEQPEFGVPDALVGAIAKCLRPAGKIGVKASATVDQVTMALPAIAGGSLGERVSAMLFALPPPKAAGGGTGSGKSSFNGIATPSGRDTASVTFLEEGESDVAGAAGDMGNVLGALSGYCGECGR